MKAIVQAVFGGPDVLHCAEHLDPTPQDQDIVVQVRAVSVNPVDTKVRRAGPAGSPLPKGPRILGWDGAGVVAAVGPSARRFKLGDEVYFAGDITRPGCYAEYVAVDERIVGHKPRSLGFEEAAALPLTSLTAWEAIFEHMGVTENQGAGSLLMVGGAGGVGSIAIQIVKRVCDLDVVATASRDESRDYCLHLGADAVIEHGRPLSEQLAPLGRAGFDYIFNTPVPANFEELATVLKPLGHICCITSGEPLTQLNVSGLFPLRGTLSFEFMFTRPQTGIQPERQGAILNRVADLVDAGVLNTTHRQTFSWRDVEHVHRAIESGHTLGKIVMQIE